MDINYNKPVNGCDECKFKVDSPILMGREYKFGCLLTGLEFNCEGYTEKDMAKKQMIKKCPLK